MRRSHGFTLIELLVVVAIIITLLAILMPAMGQAVRVSEQAVCASNLKQVGTTLSSYLFDSRGVYPNRLGSMYSWLGRNGSVYLTTLGADDRVLNKYLNPDYGPDDDVELARCPSDTGAEWGTGISSYEAQGTSYGANIGGIVPSLVDNSSKGVHMNQVRSPARMVAFADNPAYAAAWWTTAQWANNAKPGFNWHTLEQHWNIAFVDGHVNYTFVPNPERTGSDYTFDRTK